MAVMRLLRSPHVHLLVVGEQEQTQGMGSLGSAGLAALCSLLKFVTTGVRTSRPCAGSAQRRCGLDDPSLHRVESGTSTALPKPLA